MSLVHAVDQIEYPESDGKPMGETDLHRDWMSRILDILRYRYRGQQVYVASNLLVYYEQGNPAKFVVPDDFVVLDCGPDRRRTFQIWKEGKAPDVVFEVTSRGSAREDQQYKPHVYARLGVQEYFLYDPSAEYLEPPLQGFRLVQGKYVRIAPDDAGMLTCHKLKITLRLQDGNLVMYDVPSGEVVQTEAEAERSGRAAAEAARESDKTRAEAAEQRAAELEAELHRMRQELRRKNR